MIRKIYQIQILTKDGEETDRPFNIEPHKDSNKVILKEIDDDFPYVVYIDELIEALNLMKADKQK